MDGPSRLDRYRGAMLGLAAGYALGTTLEYTASAQVRAELARALAGNPRYEGLASIAFARSQIDSAVVSSRNSSMRRRIGW